MKQKTISIDNLNQMLMQFGQNIGVGSFSLDENFSTSLVFDDRFLVEFQALDREGNEVQTLYLVATLCDDSQHADKDDTIKHYQRFLQSNLAGQAMSGLSFSLDKEFNEILLIRPLSAAQLNLATLEVEMENFVNVLEQWANCLKNGVLDWSSTKIEKDKMDKISKSTQSNGLGKNGGGVRI